MEVRPALKKDIEDVARLLSILRMKKVTSKQIKNIFFDIVDSPHADVILATKDGAGVGMAVLNSALKLNRIECRLDDVIVDPSVRGGGVGTRLLEACDQWAWNKGCYKIEFTSRAERQDALRFYEKLGYTKRDSFIYTKISPTTDYVKTKVI